ncbi:MAG: CpaF family protein [Lachnospiraceae bacterium]
MESVKKRIQEEILQELDMTREVSDEELLSMIQQKICDIGQEAYLSVAQRMELQRKIFYGLRRLDVLEDLLADETITEIMVNGPDIIFVERAGRVERTELAFSSAEKLEDVIQRIVASNNKMANTSHPIVDTRLADGSRINIVLPPIALDHSVLSIRKFPKEWITMEKLVEWQALSQEVMAFIKEVVQCGYNIFVSGGTGSGKTTFINAMSEFIPVEERVITIEDSAELQMRSVANLVRLEAREATMEGKLEVSIRDLVKTSLRMRPDRIVVGECRGVEAIEMLQAFNTGHDGSFSTGHANSAKDMLSRLETMALAAGEIPLLALRSQIASGVDLIIHLERMRDKSRKVAEIVEVLGIENGEIQVQTIFAFEEKKQKEKVEGEWVMKNKMSRNQKYMRHVGKENKKNRWWK